MERLHRSIRLPSAVAIISLLPLLWSAPASAQFAADGPALDSELDSLRDNADLFRQASARRRRRRGPHATRHPHRPAPTATLNPPVQKFPVRGIDISGYQGEIDWAKVATAPEKYAFVYLRAAHGLDADEFFDKNWAGARANGFRVGAYHFYDFCEDAQLQAELFVETVHPTPGMLPEVVDIEASEECKTLPPKDVFLKNLKVFTDLFERTYGIRPMLYVNGDVYKNYFAGDNVPNKIWFADPRKEPALPDGRVWDFWQYAWKGNVPGINDKNVDFDVFHGTRAEFDAAFPVTIAAAP